MLVSGQTNLTLWHQKLTLVNTERDAAKPNIHWQYQPQTRKLDCGHLNPGSCAKNAENLILAPKS